MLKTNIPLYLQYVITRYLTTEDGFDQLCWILETRIVTISEARFSSFSLESFNEAVNFFPTRELFELYSRGCQSVGMFFPFPIQFNGLIANLLLFQVNEAMRSSLNDLETILNLYEEAKVLAKNGFNYLKRGYQPNFDFDILVLSLSKMSTIFGTCTLQPEVIDRSNDAVPAPMDISYTELEESWIKQRFSNAQAQFESVIPSKEFIFELFNLLMHGQRVSHRFSPDWLSIITERARRVLKFQPEFERLPDKYQVRGNLKLKPKSSKIHKFLFAIIHDHVKVLL